MFVFQKSYFLEKANFSEKQYSTLSTLSGEPLFQSGKDLTFLAGTFSEELFSKHTFLE